VQTNPFIHQRTKELSVYEWIKIVLMTLSMIPLIRLILIVLILLLSALWAKIVLIGMSGSETDGSRWLTRRLGWHQRPATSTVDVPMSGCRRAMLGPVRVCH
jgi:hypothetical protein